MIKRGIVSLSVLILLFSLATVLATHELGHIDEEESIPEEVQEDFDDNFDDFDDEDNSLDGDFDEEEEFEDDFDTGENDNDDGLPEFDSDHDEDDFEDITDEEVEEELGDGGSINGFDRFFDNIFQDDLENMRERFAEIRTLIREGEIEKARELLQHYKKVADKLEKEVSPEQKDEVVKLTKIIRREIKELEDKIDDDFKEIGEKAKDIGAAAEIASKINDLCKQLHELAVNDGDPDAWNQFGRVCKTEDDGPKWQKDLYEDLTKEQEEEVKKFVKIMSQCMRTSGEDCDCAGIPHDDMVAMCFQAAPLARDCNLIDHGELDPEDERFDGPAGDACDQLDALDFPDLPPHLLRALESVEQEFGEASYENHIPGPCKDAGISGRGSDDRERCFAIMVEIEAPPECRDAIIEAGVNNERDARRICEEIMFKQHAPEECIEKGITNPRDCAEFFGDEFGPIDDFDNGPGRGRDCSQIKNSRERLKCYDDTERHFDDRFENRGGENRGPPGSWPKPCREAEAFTRESCEKIMRADGDRRFQETKEEENACRNKCEAEGKAWDFSFGCRCFEGDFRDDYRNDFDNGYDDHDDYDDDYGPPENYDDNPYPGEDENYPEDSFPDNFNDFPEESTQEGPPEDSGSDSNGDSGEDSGEDNSGSSDEEDPTITGSVITGNAFLDYFFS